MRYTVEKVLGMVKKHKNMELVQVVNPMLETDASIIVKVEGKEFDIQVCDDGTLALSNAGTDLADLYVDELTSFKKVVESIDYVLHT